MTADTRVNKDDYARFVAEFEDAMDAQRVEYRGRAEYGDQPGRADSPPMLIKEVQEAYFGEWTTVAWMDMPNTIHVRFNIDRAAFEALRARIAESVRG